MGEYLIILINLSPVVYYSLALFLIGWFVIPCQRQRRLACIETDDGSGVSEIAHIDQVVDQEQHDSAGPRLIAHLRLVLLLKVVLGILKPVFDAFLQVLGKRVLLGDEVVQVVSQELRTA